MKTSIKLLLTHTLALAALFATGGGGVAVAADAPIPVAVWNGDFNVLQKTTPSGAVITLDKGSSNTLAADGSYIEIGSGLGIKFASTTAGVFGEGGDGGNKPGVTVLVKYTNLGQTSNSAVMISLLDGNGGSYDYLGVLNNAGAARGIWHSGSKGYDWNNAQANAFPTDASAFNTVAFVYRHGGSPAGSSVYVNGELKKNWSGLQGKNFTPTAIGIGGPATDSTGSPAIYPATGMRVCAVAFFNTLLTQEEIAAYKFPGIYDPFRKDLSGNMKMWSGDGLFHNGPIYPYNINDYTIGSTAVTWNDWTSSSKNYVLCFSEKYGTPHAINAQFGELYLAGLVIEPGASEYSLDSNDGNLRNTHLGHTGNIPSFVIVKEDFRINRKYHASNKTLIYGDLTMDIATGKTFDCNSQNSQPVTLNEGAIFRMVGGGTFKVNTLTATGSVTLDYSKQATSATFITGNLTIDGSTGLILPSNLAEDTAFTLCSGTLSGATSGARQITVGDKTDTATLTFEGNTVKYSWSSGPTKATATLSKSTFTSGYWSDIVWDNGIKPDANTPAEITIEGDGDVPIQQDEEIIAKSITFVKGSGSGSVSFYPVAGFYNGGKITTEVPFIIYGNANVEVDAGANNLTYFYTGSESSPTISTTGELTLSGANLKAQTAVAPSNIIFSNNATLTIDVSSAKTINGIEGAGTLIKTGAQKLTLRNKSGGYAIDGTTIEVNNGLVELSEATIRNASFNIGANGELKTYGWPTFNGTITFNSESNKDVLENTGANTTRISGSPKIVKVGSSTITLKSTSVDAGFSGVEINGGKLVFSYKNTPHNYPDVTSDLTFGSNSATAEVVENMSLTINGTLSGGGTLCGAGEVIFGADATIDVTAGSITATASTITFGNTLNIAEGEAGQTILTGLTAAPTLPTITIDHEPTELILKYDNGDIKLAKVAAASINGKEYETLADAITAANEMADAAVEIVVYTKEPEASTINVVSGKTITLVGGGDGAYVCNGAITKTGEGTLALNGPIYYPAGSKGFAPTISAGILVVKDDAISSSQWFGKTLTLYTEGVVIDDSAVFEFNVEEDFSLSGGFGNSQSDVGTVRKSGTGKMTLNLDAFLTFNGMIDVVAGSLANFDQDITIKGVLKVSANAFVDATLENTTKVILGTDAKIDLAGVSTERTDAIVKGNLKMAKSTAIVFASEQTALLCDGALTIGEEAITASKTVTNATIFIGSQEYIADLVFTVADGNAGAKLYTVGYTNAKPGIRITTAGMTASKLNDALDDAIEGTKVYFDDGAMLTLDEDVENVDLVILGTANIAGEGTISAATIDAANKTINLGEDVILIPTTPANLSTTTIAGSGTIVYNGALPGNEKTSYQDAQNWTGTVWLKNINAWKKWDIEQYGSADSFVKLTGITGYAPDSNDKTVLPEVILVDDGNTKALTMTDGYSDYVYTFRKISGTGTITTTKTGVSQTFIFKDVSTFEGKINSTNKFRIVLGDAEVKAKYYTEFAITFADGVSVKAGLGWEAANVVFGKTIVINNVCGEDDIGKVLVSGVTTQPTTLAGLLDASGNTVKGLALGYDGTAKTIKIVKAKAQIVDEYGNVKSYDSIEDAIKNEGTGGNVPTIVPTESTTLDLNKLNTDNKFKLNVEAIASNKIRWTDGDKYLACNSEGVLTVKTGEPKGEFSSFECYVLGISTESADKPVLNAPPDDGKVDTLTVTLDTFRNIKGVKLIAEPNDTSATIEATGKSIPLSLPSTGERIYTIKVDTDSAN